MDFFNLIVKSAEGKLFEGEVQSVSSENDNGPFDVLPLHTNFISIVKKSLKIKDRSGKEKVLPVETGILRDFVNRVEIYLGIDAV